MRRVAVLLLCVCMMAVVPSPALGAGAVVDVTPADLAAVTDGLDSVTVRFSGEVVSEPLRADDGHVWVNVLGEGVAMGVYMTEEMAEQITTMGDYGHDGDIVEVIGVFNEACGAHGGDMDVHADSLAVLTAGAERERLPQLWKGAVGVAGLLVAVFQTRRFHRKRDEVVS